MNSLGGSPGYGSSAADQGKKLSGKLKENVPKGYRQGRTSNYTPEMMKLFRSLFSQLGPDSDLYRMAEGDEDYYEDMEAPAWRQFQEAQGDLASRFSGSGMGARKGSGFQNAVNQQSSDFAMGLQSRRQDLQRQAIKDLMGMSGDLLNQRPYENYLVPKYGAGAGGSGGSSGGSGSGWGGLIGAGLGGLGGFFAGGPGGAMAGASIGQRIGSPF